MFVFKAQLEIIGINPFVFVPAAILESLFRDAGISKGYIPVKGKVNDREYVQTLLRFKGEWRLYINPELEAAFALNAEAKQVFDGLSPSKRKEIIRYISSLKTAESRRSNIQKAIGFLLGKNRFVGREKP